MKNLSVAGGQPVANLNSLVPKTMDLVNSIDFTWVKRKLMDPEEGQGWSQELADSVETRYRRFLCMLHLDRSGSVVPTKDIDIFWHQHILDTRAYARDCDRVFGEFMHHFPYFGMRGDEDAENLHSSFEKTKVLYASFFGEPYCETGENSDSGKCAKCGKGFCHHEPTRCGRRIN